MKIRTVQKSYAEVMALPRPKHRKPLKPHMFFRVLLKVLSLPAMLMTRFSVKKIGMEKLGKNEPCLFLMNHSGFIDMKIASSILFPRPFNIVCTTDGFVGKGWLMRLIGCIPTRKFVTDVTLIRDMEYILKKKKCSVLMYPEASCSFD
ncbi:MAG: 1-acyl-sn-glycerol-3-phosphate acyltransferase, partial [Oscillospiraceae bacterium]|nr:1-acyl-sn-glycerol-3-phosphate acyltransferase [Oscillospiraceae bacterium]